MPVNARYVPDHVSFGRFILSRQAQDPAVEAAEDVAKVAATTAVKRTGNYASGFRVNKNPGPLTVGGNPRAIAEVYNSDDAAAPQEFGDRWGNPAHRTLRRSADFLGDVGVVG